MRYLLLLFSITAVFLTRLATLEAGFPGKWRQVNIQNAAISSPEVGQMVQGSVVIRGDANLAGFQSYEVDFSYSDDSHATWFLIQESTVPVQDGILAVCDTSTITDGKYDLRLVIYLQTGDPVQVIVRGLRVRNYTLAETNTPTSTSPYETIAAGTQSSTITPPAAQTMIKTPPPMTVTPLPTNPAQITTSQLMLTMGKGVAITVGLFALVGAYAGLRSLLHHRR